MHVDNVMHRKVRVLVHDDAKLFVDNFQNYRCIKLFQNLLSQLNLQLSWENPKHLADQSFCRMRQFTRISKSEANDNGEDEQQIN